MSIRLSTVTSAKLAELADHTQRSQGEIAGTAIDAYVDRELAIISGVQRGLEDMKAGRVTAHGDVMAELDDIITQAERSRKTG